MGFRSDAYAKVWKVENKGNYSIVEMSTSKKNKETDKYETDFSYKFVRFIGEAHKLVQTLQEGSSIKLGNIEVTNSYDKEKKIGYTNYLVFSFEIPDGNNSTKQNQASSNSFVNIPDGLENEELPFA